jgi:hypothetical protein
MAPPGNLEDDNMLSLRQLAVNGLSGVPFVDNLSRKPTDRRQDADIAPVSRTPTLAA